VPFALAAGLSGAIDDSRIVAISELAEIDSVSFASRFCLASCCDWRTCGRSLLFACRNWPPNPCRELEQIILLTE
jgi:hypothetical protein